MSGSLAELVIDGGIVELKCPITGIPLIVENEGFDSDAHHSPHLRFFLDWSDQAWVVDPDDLPEEQAPGQRRLVEILTNDEAFDSQHAMIDACVEALPGSALVLEILDPPEGAFDGEVCYACYDLGSRAAADAVRLHLAEPAEAAS
ncbi:MAG: hypothetical protein WEA34_14575, partial [Gemmatimonadota bacterium]